MCDLDEHIVYAPAAHTDIGPHVFPIEKYRLVYARLRAEDGLQSPRLPTPCSDRRLERVHTPAYLADLATGRHTDRTRFSELPLSAEIASFFRLACGGTVVAALQALRAGWAAHLGGGFHHAFADRAEGFCYINDLAVAARAVLAEASVERICVIDLDVHQGNGTARIFLDDPSVFTFSLHQEDNYPVKERSDLDIGLPSWDPSRPGSPFVTDDLYLATLVPALERVLDSARPELVLYQAGADPYEDDQLGGFRLSRPGLRRRDETVFDACRVRGIPYAVTLGGGYARRVEDTVAIHVATVRAAGGSATVTAPSTDPLV
jgi:acetoin utilization deacetylase AcuC-like enzyme